MPEYTSNFSIPKPATTDKIGATAQNLVTAFRDLADRADVSLKQVQAQISTQATATEKKFNSSLAGVESALREEISRSSAFNFQGVYVPGATYKDGDAVNFEGSLWVRRGSDGTQAPGTGPEWVIAVAKGEEGAAGGSTAQDAVIAGLLATASSQTAKGVVATREKQGWLVATDYGVSTAASGEVNFTAFTTLFNKARAEKRGVYIPAGKYKVTGSLDISGLTIRGDYIGYQGANGTILVGDGVSTLLDQKQLNASMLTMNFSGFRIEDAGIGLSLRYSIFSSVSDITIMRSTIRGADLGVDGVIGPIWNTFTRVYIRGDGTALRLGGKDWNNANKFDTCLFHGAPAVEIAITGGYGALKNVFHNTELAGLGAGLFLNGTTRGTSLRDCYLETRGPAVVINGVTTDMVIDHAIFGTTSNDVPGFTPSFIEHQSGNTSLTVHGGWVTTGSEPRQEGLRFVSSLAPASLNLRYLMLPMISVPAAGWALHGAGVTGTQPQMVSV